MLVALLDSGLESRWMSLIDHALDSEGLSKICNTKRTGARRQQREHPEKNTRKKTHLKKLETEKPYETTK